MTTFIKPMYKIVVLMLTLAGLFGLSGCGQKGPLYLPEEGKAAKQKSQAPEPQGDQTTQ